MAYLSSDIIDPTAPTSLAVTGAPSSVYPTTNLLNLSLRSDKSEHKAKIAITSDAVTMSNPVSLMGAFAEPPSPVTMERKDLSSTSLTLLKVTPVGVKPFIPPLCATLSVRAASKLCA